ncbi:MAG: carboxypeptidase-like regulatory domain-containing protein [Lewinella sp.]|uniref:carboxypeptidase-like regulatory domain-containing protein n=1 Tax=Lewinella sp. TaxID=2004506 RepID=UPI003D6AEFA7
MKNLTQPFRIHFGQIPVLQKVLMVSALLLLGTVFPLRAAQSNFMFNLSPQRIAEGDTRPGWRTRGGRTEGTDDPAALQTKSAVAGAHNHIVQDTLPNKIMLTGTVKSAATGDALIGVSIFIRSTVTGTVTDIDGAFEIPTRELDTLWFSYTGFETQELIVLPGQERLDVLMVDISPFNSGCGYILPSPFKDERNGILNFSVLPPLHFTHPYQLLRGQFPGLVVSQAGSDPWAVPVLRQQGVHSLTQNAAPLWVVDGMPGMEPLLLDQQSIASVKLLRRPVDLVRYGLQSGAGVLEVETTDIVRKKLAVVYQGQLTIERSAYLPNVATAEEYRQYPGGISDLGYGTDWLDEVTRTALSQGHQLAVSGRDGATIWQVEGSFRDVQGVGQNSEWRQYTGRAQLQQSFWRERLVIKAQVAGQQRQGERDYQQTFFQAAKYNPTTPVSFTEPPTNSLLNGFYNISTNQLRDYFEVVPSIDFYNPVAIQAGSKLLEERSTRWLRAEANLQIADPLRLQLAVGQQANDRRSGEENRTYAFFRGNGHTTQPGRAERTVREQRQEWLRTRLNWEHVFMYGLLELEGSYGFQRLEREDERTQGFNFGNDDFSFDNFETFLTDQSFLQQSGYDERTRLIDFGLNGKLRWRWLEWQVAMKYQGATNLGTAERWQPAGGTHLDLRLNEIFNINSRTSWNAHGGYAQVGQLPRDFSYARGQYDPIREDYVNVNPELKPERRRIVNAGLNWYDYQGFFGSIDYFASMTKDPIVKQEREDLPAALNEFGVNLSQAALRNRSWELAIGWQKGRQLQWTTTLRWAHMKTQLVSTGGIGPDSYFDANGQRVTAKSGAGGSIWRNGIGLVELDAPFGQMIGRQFDRETTLATGEISLYDTFQGEALPSPDGDYGVIGNGLPTNTYSWSNTFSYQGWQLEVMLRGELGHDLAHLRRGELETFIDQEGLFPQSRNYMSTAFDLPDNVSGFATFSDRYIESGNYLSLDYLSISRVLYLPNQQSLSISLTGQNLLLWTNYTGIDPSPRYIDEGPEIAGVLPTLRERDGQLAPGIDRRYFYPRSKALTLGLKWGM